ncbi:MAG: hypothetical protein MUF54_13155 [Polyangiaceae bacterium]|nr:hypothetical protein [Polyangiaceae bacterium]
MESRVRDGKLLAYKYRDECVPGVGGTGVVVSARHVELDERVVLGCLEKRPEARCSTVANLAEDLLPFAPQRAKVLVKRARAVLDSPRAIMTSSLADWPPVSAKVDHAATREESPVVATWDALTAQGPVTSETTLRSGAIPPQGQRFGQLDGVQRTACRAAHAACGCTVLARGGALACDNGCRGFRYSNRGVLRRSRCLAGTGIGAERAPRGIQSPHTPQGGFHVHLALGIAVFGSHSLRG